MLRNERTTAGQPSLWRSWLWRAAVLVGTAWTSVAQAQAPFEGVVTMRIGGGAAAGAPNMPQEMEYLISGKRVRVNMGGPTGAMSLLMMPSEKKLYMLLSAQKSYMEMPMGDELSNTAVPAGVSMVKTGRTETIAGYRCEHIELTGPGPSGTPQKTDACLSKELGGYANPMAGMGGGREAPWQKAIQAEGFPLKVTSADGSVALEVTKVEKKRLGNDLFTVPLSYSKVAMPQRR
jgi:hypothetical protein